MNGEGLPLLLQEVNHRIRNLLAMIEAVLGQTESRIVHDYRQKVIARISGLSDFYEVMYRSDTGRIRLAELLEQTMRSCCARSGQVVLGGPDVELGSQLALWLHLVVHELATNARKYGALSSTGGTVNLTWEVQQTLGAAGKLALVWYEAGGPEVKQPKRRGFGSRLITKALDQYGDVQLHFGPAGVACSMLINLDRDLGP
ncbi:sensor histidine kinase [Bradyrhizobium sp. RDM12]